MLQLQGVVGRTAAARQLSHSLHAQVQCVTPSGMQQCAQQYFCFAGLWIAFIPGICCLKWAYAVAPAIIMAGRASVQRNRQRCSVGRGVAVHCFVAAHCLAFSPSWLLCCICVSFNTCSSSMRSLRSSRTTKVARPSPTHRCAVAEAAAAAAEHGASALVQCATALAAAEA